MQEQDMALSDLDSAFPGSLYAGDGVRVAGAGPDIFTPEMDADLPFKALIHGGPAMDDDDALALEDLLWVLPERFSTPDVPPTPLLCHLADVILAGGKVGLASTDQVMCDQARDMLILVLAEPTGNA